MLVICEDCAKKYNIDESRIKGNRARFTCTECGHIIIVDKADINRPLVHVSPEQKTSPSSLDLLKEMEAPLSTDADDSGQKDNTKSEGTTSSESDKPKDKTKKGLSVKAYFMAAGALCFAVVNGGTGFILSQHYATIGGQQMELHSNLLTTSLLIMGGAWIVSFAIMFGIGTYLSKSITNLSASVTRLNQGEMDIEITGKGPQEVTNMAQIISELSGKLR